MAPDTIACQCSDPACEERVPARPAGGRLGVRIVAPGPVDGSDGVVEDHGDHWLIRSLDPINGDDDPSALSFPASDPPPGPGSV